MKKSILPLIVTLILLTSCSQKAINSLIEKNLKSRYTDVEIVSIKPDSCPDLKGLFDLSLSIEMVASECRLNISQITGKYYQGEYSLDQVSSLCGKEIDKIRDLADYWRPMYSTNSNRCMLVKYMYGNAYGIKTTMEEHYSTDPQLYQQGNYPYLRSELTDDFGLRNYWEVIGDYKKFLMQVIIN